MIRTEYIYPQIPELPAEPEYYEVRWIGKDGLYCIDADNAKNLLKNIELMKGYQEEMMLIMEGLR
ncbi:MAG: hypothetical protein HY096_09750 [Nitrospinae bacterium]|nr:hypothetical protein [Nitrospinota bacterium]